MTVSGQPVRALTLATMRRLADAGQLLAAAPGHAHHHRLRLLIAAVLVVIVVAAAAFALSLWRRRRGSRSRRADAQAPHADQPEQAEDGTDGPLACRRRGALYTIGRWSARHRYVVIVAWLAVLAGTVLGNHAIGAEYADNFTLPGTAAQTGADLLHQHRPSAGGQSSQLVFTVTSGTLTARRAAVERAMANVLALPDVLAASDPMAAGAVTRNGQTAYATVHFSVNPQSLGPSYVGQVDDAVAPARQAGVSVNYGGQLGQAALPKNKDPRSEEIGIAAAIVVLLAGFGSLWATALPVVSALAGAFAGVSGLGMLAAATTFPTVSPTLAIMMGLGVGIDYALFLTTRHRQLVLDGTPPEEAAALSLATSGRAVLVAALTVVVAMLGLYASGVVFIGKLGLAAALTVAVAALSAITVVPALLAVAGTAIDKFRVRRPVAEATVEHVGWRRYAEHVGAHPWRYLTAGLAVLAILSIPALSMQLGHVGRAADPAGSTARKAYDALSAGFGPGANSPLTVVAQVGPGVAGTPRESELAGQLHAALAATPDVAAVSPVRPTPDGAVLYATVLPGSGPQDTATDTLMHTVQNATLPSVLFPSDSRGYVTGATAGQLQFRDIVASRLPVIIVVVVAAAFVLLLAAFRSPVLALKAAVLNLLSIGAAFGVIVAVFQWGWGSSLLGVSGKVPIESYVPMMIFAIVFGLSMDYEVFLLSRVREAWLQTGSNHRSVAAGLAGTARVITCAALIMASVFAAFLLSTSVTIKMLALGLALSVLIDASVIRLVVVPAAMFLLGRYNWWAPAWLARSRGAAVPQGAPSQGRQRRTSHAPQAQSGATS